MVVWWWWWWWCVCVSACVRACVRARVCVCRDGAAAIAAALRSNTTITELVIGSIGSNSCLPFQVVFFTGVYDNENCLKPGGDPVGAR